MNKLITNTSNEKLNYTFFPGARPARNTEWVVVLGHGVTGDKERPVVADTAAALNAAGFDTLRFSFAGNGNSDGDFGDATVSKEVGDLAAVLDAVSAKYDRICYVGHSMGSAVGVIQAAQDLRIHALISLAGMVDTKAFAEAEFGDETPDKGLMWEEENCPLSSAFMKDLCNTVGSVASQAETVAVPWLLLHGSKDDVVNPKDSELIKSLKGDAATTIVIKKADHSFNEPKHKTAMTEAVVAWMTEQAAPVEEAEPTEQAE